MKKITLWTLVLLSSCSTKKDGIEENSGSDTTATTQPGSAPTESKGDADFPLDSLLTFDSEAELIAAFGDSVKRSVGQYPEGMGEYPNSLLFPGTKDEVEFVWLDDSVSFSGLASIRISGQESRWKTKESITLGTKLKDLEKLNQKPFIFYGFGWDYSGMVNWDKGHLFDRNIRVSLEYPGVNIPPEYEELLGDQEIRSDSELAQKANPVVREITMWRQQKIR